MVRSPALWLLTLLLCVPVTLLLALWSSFGLYSVFAFAAWSGWRALDALVTVGAVAALASLWFMIVSELRHDRVLSFRDAPLLWALIGVGLIIAAGSVVSDLLAPSRPYSDAAEFRERYSFFKLGFLVLPLVIRFVAKGRRVKA